MSIQAKSVHVRIAARDWKALAAFYEAVFGCVTGPLERAPESSSNGPGKLPGAPIGGVQLRLRGDRAAGTILEIVPSGPLPSATGSTRGRRVARHMTFDVKDALNALTTIVRAGGRALGRSASTEIAGAGRLTRVCAADPEGNILELQQWQSRSDVTAEARGTETVDIGRRPSRKRLTVAGRAGGRTARSKRRRST